MEAIVQTEGLADPPRGFPETFFDVRFDLVLRFEKDGHVKRPGSLPPGNPRGGLTWTLGLRDILKTRGSRNWSLGTGFTVQLRGTGKLRKSRGEKIDE